MDLTIDQPAAGWDGQVGFVTEPLARLRLDPDRTTAFLCGPEPMMRFCAQVLLRKGIAAEDIRLSLERNMQCGIGLCGHCQLGPILVCRDGPVVGYALAESAADHPGVVMTKPTLAVWKLASCDGCQLTLLDCEDELLTLPGVVTIAHFLEASSAVQPGPYDISLVEGSITTARDAERILQIREQSRILVTIGACATAGGIQALRNFGDVAEFTAAVYASPEYIDTLATSTPVAAHVPGRLRAARLPDRPPPAPRGADRVPGRPQARISPTPACAPSASAGA